MKEIEETLRELIEADKEIQREDCGCGECCGPCAALPPARAE